MTPADNQAMHAGVDDVDSYEDVSRFVRVVSENSAVNHFIIHARKCLLNGLSPHQNRTIPPLKSSHAQRGFRAVTLVKV